jgi:hypothetical protein
MADLGLIAAVFRRSSSAGFAPTKPPTLFSGGLGRLSRTLSLALGRLATSRSTGRSTPSPCQGPRARRDRSLSPSQRYLKLLDWTILLTNVPPHHATAQRLLEAYGTRWQIELLFKSFGLRLQTALSTALSPLKIAAYLCRLLPLIAASPHRNWLDHFLYFCRYDSRRRPNFFQKLTALC